MASLPQPQIQHLLRLTRHEARSSFALGLRPAVMKALERRGLAEKVVSENDVWLWRLTANGDAMKRQLTTPKGVSRE